MPKARKTVDRSCAGRKEIYCKELADFTCEIIATHAHGLNRLKRMYPRFPDEQTVYKWIYKYPEFATQYAEARKRQASVLAESMLEDAESLEPMIDEKGMPKIDAGVVGKAKLVIDVKKWHASKVAPKLWGDAKMIEEVITQNVALKKELDELRWELKLAHDKDY